MELDVDGNSVGGGSVDGQGNKVKHSDTVEVATAHSLGTTT